jgi:S1-C subfamily serine protease
MTPPTTPAVLASPAVNDQPLAAKMMALPAAPVGPAAFVLTTPVLRRARPQQAISPATRPGCAAPVASAQQRPPVAAAAAAAAAIIAANAMGPLPSLAYVDRLAPGPVLTPQETNVVQLFNTAAKSVVNVTTLGTGGQPKASGSGFIYQNGKGDSGYVVTNYHVIRNGLGAKVTLSDQKTYDAKLRGYDADKDIAVLEINASKEELVDIAMGTSKNLVVGQSTYAIGNPFGLDHSLTSGVLSGLGRDMKSPTGRIINKYVAA